MDNEFGKNTVVLTDENGQEVELEHLDTVEYKNATYMAFIPAEMSVEDSYELIIMKVEEEDGEDVLVTLDDEDELDEMFQIFSERLEDVFEGEEEKPSRWCGLSPCPSRQRTISKNLHDVERDCFFSPHLQASRRSFVPDVGSSVKVRGLAHLR